MNNEQALVKANGGELAPAEATESLVTMISKAARDPSVDVGKMERLLAMYQTVMEEQRKANFAAAMSRLQAKLPQIKKDGKIIVKGTERSRYARIEDIDVAIRPLLAEEGFALSFDSESGDGKNFKLSCKLSHRDGHSETKYLPLPLDQSEYRSNVQSVGSTISYGRRLLIKMHLNLIERGEDDNGSGGDKPISKEQVEQLKTVFAEVRNGQRLSQPKFLSYMGVEKIDAILSREWPKAMNAVDTWRRANAKA